VVSECSGQFKTQRALGALLQASIWAGQRCDVACPLLTWPDCRRGSLNVVFGINHRLYDPSRHRLLTAASCTTTAWPRCLKVVHEFLGIRHGSITTLHDVTATQS